LRPCCHFSRRQFLQWAGVVAATPLVAAFEDVERAYGLTNGVKDNRVLPINLELVTLTETTAILTWFTGDPMRPDRFGRLAPMPADTDVLLGPDPDERGLNFQTVHYDARQTPYHYVEITGLEPGRTYSVLARSNGVQALPAANYFGSPFGTSGAGVPAGPLTFTTPQPPPGKHLFSIALCNDLHLGETVAGLAKTAVGVGIPPGISQLPGKRPYPEITATALAREARERGAQLLLAAGDVTGEASPTDLRKARELLDGFGTYNRDYFVARGNHDRAHDNDESKSCTPVAGHPHRHDCFADEFAPHDETWFAREAFGLRLIGIDTYDTIGNGAFRGAIGPEQFAFLREQLRRDRDRPTIVFGHHPLVLDATSSSIPPVAYGLRLEQSRELTALYRHAPGVFLHHAGHTHRNKRAISPNAPGVVFQEVAAVKEYPGGFHLLRVHTGGYALNFYKFKDPAAQEWSERSRPEYLGLAPLYTAGNRVDRNSVVARDLSGLGSAHA
jgi:hypothetical protein